VRERKWEMVVAAQSGEREDSVRTGVGAERRHDNGTVPKPAMFGSAFDGDAGGAGSEGRVPT
jgi:hypothetical protein